MDDWNFDDIDPSLGPFHLDHGSSDFGWSWWVSSYLFRLSDWRPVLFEHFRFLEKYRYEIREIVELLDVIDIKQAELTEILRSRLQSEGRNMKRWEVPLSRIGKIMINHTGKSDVASVYFGEFIPGVGYRHANFVMDMCGEIIDLEVGSELDG